MSGARNGSAGREAGLSRRFGAWTLLCLALALASCEAPTLARTQDGAHSTLRFRADYWLDHSPEAGRRTTPPVDAPWAPRTETFLRPFPPEARMWARIQVQGAAPGAPLVLVQPDARADYTDFFLMRGKRLERVQPDGDARASAWPRPFLAPVLFFDAADAADAAPPVVYVRLGNAVDLSLQFELYHESEFHLMARQRYFFQAAFFGVVFVLIFFYSAAFFSLRLPLLGDYAIYMLALSAYFLSRSGCLAQYLAPGAPWAANQITAPLPGLIFFCGLRFIRSFLGLRDARPGLDRAVRAAQWIALAPLGLVFYSRPHSILAGDVISLIFGPLIWVLGFALSFKLAEARWFLIGWTLPILAGAADSYLPRGIWREAGLQGAVLIEVLMFAWFVGRKIGEIESARARQNAHLFSLQLELERARDVHGALLPRELDLPDSIDAHVLYRPVGGLGGDYYQTAALADGRRGVFLADVTGHGLAAAMNASTVHIAFHSALSAAVDAGDLLTRMNGMLAADHNYRFVSALYVIVDPQTLALEFSSAGHPDALVRRADNRMERAGQESPWLGMLPEFEYQTVRSSARPGDALVLFTDGLYEAPHSDANPSDSLIESVVARALAKGGPLEGIAQELIAEFDRLRGREAEDDVTLLLLRFNGAPEPQRPPARLSNQRDAV